MDTTTLVIFGASGDLARRKLLPALYGLHRKGRLPEPFHLVGAARSPGDDDSFRQRARGGVEAFSELEASSWESFSGRIRYRHGDFADASAAQGLARFLDELAGGSAARHNIVFYLATPPQAYVEMATSLGAAGLLRETDGFRRVVIEKPFGSDLDSARTLNAALLEHLHEHQIFRIDHYLGKETVQNVLVFRFANSIFEPIWNRNYIDHVEITVAESVGIEHRGRFYDSVGVLRDVFQNHVLQLLAMAAMEPPASFDPEALRDERRKVLEAVRPMSEEEVRRETVRGQYEEYLAEEGVDPASQTATYGAIRLLVDNWRWHGVPWYLRSGKAMAEKTTQITVQFKSVPHLMFPLAPRETIRPNALFLCLQPDEGIHLRFEVKVPDNLRAFRSVDMEFHYDRDFGPAAIPDSYERLLLDAIHGDASLFMRADTIELGWAWIDPIRRVWDSGIPALSRYPRGSWGPVEAEQFMAREGRGWSMGCREGGP